MFFKPPGGGLFGYDPFSSQSGSSLSPLLDLITGLGGMVGKPKIIPTDYRTPPYVEQQAEFKPDPGVMIFMPNDKSNDDWKNWNQTWGIERSPGMPDLPSYPVLNDSAAGLGLGDQIRRAWHDVHKDFAFNAVQNHFPDFTAPEPQPDQSYHEFIATMLQPPIPQETFGPAMPPFKNPAIYQEQNTWPTLNIQEQPQSVVETPQDIDITKPYQTGEEAVTKAANTVGNLFGHGDYLKDIAWVETKYGKDKNTFTPKDGEDYFGGIWQIERSTLGETKNIQSHPRLKKYHQKIKDELGIDWNNVKYEDLTSPLYSALAARLKLLTIPKEIPSSADLVGRANYWKTYYNSSSGKGSDTKYIGDINARDKEISKQ
ncbi:MAG: hypothetical protein EYC62_01070 [Alphaproteobacteria bacterium]|nr:MAG: hypothetical protein EYC62_01070 [Alphaproteobacteria bacterium]